MHHNNVTFPQTRSRHTEQPPTFLSRPPNWISALHVILQHAVRRSCQNWAHPRQTGDTFTACKDTPNMSPGAVEHFAPPCLHHAASLRTGMTQGALNDCLHDEVTMIFNRDTLFDCHREALRPVVGSGTTANWRHSQRRGRFTTVCRTPIGARTGRGKTRCVGMVGSD